MERGAGILMHISSLPGKFGIGTFGKEAYKFADFLNQSGIKYWQLLPVGHTSYGDSPYQCFSAFAGNPYFIDFDILAEQGLLEEEDYLNENYGTDEETYNNFCDLFEEALYCTYNKIDFIDQNSHNNSLYLMKSILLSCSYKIYVQNIINKRNNG